MHYVYMEMKKLLQEKLFLVQEIENAYQHTLDHARLVIQENDCFRENGVHSYEDYLAYEQKTLNGRDGYDYTVYSEMRRLISEDIKQSPMYLQEYGDAVRQYRISGGARNSILPYEVLAYAGSILFFLSAHSPNMTAMLLKSIPAVVGSILTALLLQNAFSGQNVFYWLSGVRYCEMIVAAVVWIVGFLLNIYSPESDCRCGVRRGIISKRKRYLYRIGENIGKK